MRRFSPPAEHLHQHRHHPADDPAGAGAHRREPALLAHFLGPPALQRPDPGLELLVLRLHSLERPADPLHVPVRLVKPSSRVVFSSVILVSPLEESRTPKRKSLAVRDISGKSDANPRPHNVRSGKSMIDRCRGHSSTFQKSNLKQCTEFRVDAFSVVCIKLTKFCDDQILQNSSYFVQSDHRIHL